MKKKEKNKREHISGESSKETRIEHALIDNFIALQKVMTNLSVKFDNLSDQISKLLNLFEISAKVLAEKDFEFERGKKEDKKIIENIDNLIEQNKIIARGIALLHDKNWAGETEESPSQESNIQTNQPPQQRIVTAEIPQYAVDLRGYEKSISSGSKKLPSNI